MDGGSHLHVVAQHEPRARPPRAAAGRSILCATLRERMVVDRIHELRIGSELAGYRLEALLGRGGMGVVYRAHDLALDRDVALKLLAPELADGRVVPRAVPRESRLAASLEHPNVVPIHDAGEIDGQLYIAMRYVEGSDLKAAAAPRGRSSRRAAIAHPRAGRRRARRRPRARARAPRRQALERAARRARARLPGRLRPRAAGSAAATGSSPAQSLGTIDYVAPEQIRGEEVDGRADVYSLGCLLYECLAGEPPFRCRSDAAVLFAHLEEEPPTLPALETVLATASPRTPTSAIQLRRAGRGGPRGAGIWSPAAGGGRLWSPRWLAVMARRARVRPHAGTGRAAPAPAGRVLDRRPSGRSGT